jgi:hypothetical protein
LTVSLGGLNVDSSLIETRHSLISMVLINDVHQFVAGLEALGHKRQHHVDTLLLYW